MNKKEISLIEKDYKGIKEDIEDLQKYVEEFSLFLPLAVCTINPLGFILGVNKAFQDLTGYGEIEIIGEDASLLFLEKKEVEDLKKKIPKTEGRIAEEMTLLTKNKKKIPVSVFASSRKDNQGNFLGYFLAISDISEIKKFQEKLEKKVKERTKALELRTKELKQSKEEVEEEKNKTLAIITNFTDGLLFFNEEKKLSLINPRAKIFFNVREKDIVGKSISALDVSPALRLLKNLMEEGTEEVSRKELQLRENLILEVSTVSVVREKEKLGNLVILHDVTREKMVERMKNEFVSLSAHQLRTPLSAIKWTLKMLLSGDLGQITEEQEEFLKKTYSSNERMINLINDLLNVTRIEEGRYLFKPVLGNIEPIIKSVINSYKEEIKKRKLKFKLKKTGKGLPKTMIDVEKIRLVIQNLLDNAIRYTKAGGQVIVSINCNKNEIEFSVKDTGVGITKNQQERLFTKFFRAANAIKMEAEGSGLGLFISKNIIEAHGGKIWFESKEKKGSTFYFTLPIKI